MKFAVVATLLIGCMHRVPPADPRCAGGGPLFQGDNWRDNHDIRLWISTVGAWTYSESGGSIERGCLDAGQLDDVNNALAHATWMRPRVNGDHSCDGRERPLSFHVRDQLVFTIDCPTYPDDTTATAIVEIFAIVTLARH